MKLIDVLTAQVAEQERSVQSRKEKGWKEKDLKIYKAGVTNTLGDLIDHLRGVDLITSKEWDNLNESLIEILKE